MYNPEPDRTRIIAVCGKGGAGKTTISAAITKILLEQGESKILAIDADPAVGLALALGFKVHKTIDDIRNDLIERLRNGKGEDKQEIVSSLDYAVFDALEENDKLAFLAIGRPENEGCYCQVNNMLKDIIGSITKNFDYAVIDGEAGIEQVNRRVMEKVSHLIIVSDSSAKGLLVAKAIKDVSDRAVNYETVGLILNRIRSGEEKMLSIPQELKLLGSVPEDDTIRNFDIEGKSISELTECPAITAVRNCLIKIGLI